VKWIDQVLKVALERQPVPLTDEELAIAVAVPVVVAAAAEIAGTVKH
jgi:ATP-dependent Lon protease